MRNVLFKTLPWKFEKGHEQIYLHNTKTEYYFGTDQHVNNSPGMAAYTLLGTLTTANFSSFAFPSVP